MRCSDCGYVWRPLLDGVDEEHRITTSAFTDIAQRSLRQTFRKVAESYPLSHATVKNVFEGFFREHASSLKFKVPTAVGLCSVRLHHVGRISVVCDLDHHTLFDLMPAGFSPGDAGVSFDWRDELEKGQWAIYGIQASSLQFAIQAFPTAKTVVHRCHVEQLLALACNDVRNNYDGEIRNVIDQECATGADLVETAVFDDRSFRWGQTIQESIRTLKTGFLEVYRHSSKSDASAVLHKWKSSIPSSLAFDSIRLFATAVDSAKEQVFNFWDCPVSLSHVYERCINRLQNEASKKGRSCSFDTLRARTLYRDCDLQKMIDGRRTCLGPSINMSERLFITEPDPMDRQ